MVKKRANYWQRIALLLMLGLATSAWLLYHHVEVNAGYHSGPSACDLGGVFNCTQVAQSKYSEFFGIPVASLGAWYYALMLALLLVFIPSIRKDETLGRFIAGTVYVLSLIALVPSLMLAGLSFFSLGAICIFCTVLYVLNIVIALLAWKSPHRGQPPLPIIPSVLGTVQSVFSAAHGMRTVLVAGIGVGVAALLQVTPVLLVEQYFEPRQEARNSEATLRPLYEQWRSSQLIEDLAQLHGSAQADFSKGDLDADLVLVEFSDFQCGYCRRAAGVITDLLERMPKGVRFVFKNFPLDPSCNELIPEGRGHTMACRAALMALCAGVEEPEKFWAMHDAIFELDDWSEGSLVALPELIGLDPQRYQSCLEDPKMLERVQTDIAAGIRAGVNGTPTFYLNGRLIPLRDLNLLEPFLRYVLVKRE